MSKRKEEEIVKAEMRMRRIFTTITYYYGNFNKC